jgi:hypothetical protein
VIVSTLLYIPVIVSISSYSFFVAFYFLLFGSETICMFTPCTEEKPFRSIINKVKKKGLNEKKGTHKKYAWSLQEYMQSSTSLIENLSNEILGH